ncbi:MAG TPA: hypothetical protein VGG25_22220 [Streptosporangiaceae bacterium]|jgi:hypothetical protein
MRFQPVNDVDNADATLGDSRLATVEPRVDHDLDGAVLRELYAPRPAAVVGHTRQVVADDRAENLLTAPDHDRALHHVLVRRVARLLAEIPQNFGSIGLQALARKRLQQANVILQPEDSGPDPLHGQACFSEGGHDVGLRQPDEGNADTARLNRLQRGHDRRGHQLRAVQTLARITNCPVPEGRGRYRPGSPGRSRRSHRDRARGSRVVVVMVPA